MVTRFVTYYVTTFVTVVPCVQALQETIPVSTPRPQLQRCDARKTDLPSKVDAVLTSPPYPAVYDYLSTARSIRARSPPDLEQIAGGFDFDLTIVPQVRHL